MITSFVGRSFKLWEYKVSHGMLLLRSPKGTPGAKQNIDVMLAGVRYMDLPATCNSLQMLETLPADVEFAKGRLGMAVASKDVFVFSCNSQRHTVVAVGIKISENDLDIFESPFK